jgi:hypothetical protein
MYRSVQFPLSPGMLGAAALLMVSIFSSQADAMSPIGPGRVPAKSVANGLTIEVRGGHGGGGGGGGGRGAGGWSGGHGFSAGGPGSSFVRGGAIGAATVAAPVATAGAPRFAGHGFVHRHHHFGRVFVGGVYYDDYPYDDSDYYDFPAVPAYPVYPAPAFVAGGGCHRVLTVHGPRVVCHHSVKRHTHRTHRRLHRRKYHHA